MALGPRLQRLSMRYAPSSLARYMHQDQVSLVPVITEHCPLLTHLEVDNLRSSGAGIVQSPRQMLHWQVPACSGAMVYRMQALHVQRLGLGLRASSTSVPVACRHPVSKTGPVRHCHVAASCACPASQMSSGGHRWIGWCKAARCGGCVAMRSDASLIQCARVICA